MHSATGYRTDLAGVSRVAARSGAWLFVDACQAAGSVPLDVVGDGVDFLAASSHKFFLGARGMGYLFVRRPLLDRIRPWPPVGRRPGNHSRVFTDRPWICRRRRRSSTVPSSIWFASLAEQAAFSVFSSSGFPRFSSATRRSRAGCTMRWPPTFRCGLPARIAPPLCRCPWTIPSHDGAPALGQCRGLGPRGPRSTVRTLLQSRRRDRPRGRTDRTRLVLPL